METSTKISPSAENIPLSGIGLRTDGRRIGKDLNAKFSIPGKFSFFFFFSGCEIDLSVSLSRNSSCCVHLIFSMIIISHLSVELQTSLADFIFDCHTFHLTNGLQNCPFAKGSLGSTLGGFGSLSTKYCREIIPFKRLLLLSFSSPIETSTCASTSSRVVPPRRAVVFD